MTKKGKVKFFLDDKGYGFITEEGTGKEYFVHITGIDYDNVEAGDSVTFKLKEGKKGLVAYEVSLGQ